MNLIKYGEKFFDELEIQKIAKKAISASVELNQISSASEQNIARSVIRGVKDGKVGLYLVDSWDDSLIKEGIDKAYKLSKLNNVDRDWPGFPAGTVSKSADEFDPPAADIFVGAMADTLKMVRQKNPRAMVVGGESGAQWLHTEIINSHGTDVVQSDFSNYMILVMLGRQGTSVTPSIFDMELAKSGDIGVQGMVDRCLKKMELAMTVKNADTGESPMIFEPFALAELLQFAMLPAFSGERKYKGTSMLSGKEGEKIVSDMISIYDDPHNERLPTSMVADDEGVPLRKNALVENGVMKGYLWNHYWARRAGVESTGNGVRSFRTGAVSIGAHNIVVAPGKRTIDELISDMEDGYVVSSLQGAHSSNPDTGDFAVVANPAYRVEDGQITGSSVFMISGNIYGLLSNVVEVAAELRPVYMGPMGRGLYPAIEFENVKVAKVSR